MNDDRTLLDPRMAQRLADRLKAIGAVSRYDVPGEPQADTLVHSLSDLEEAFRKILSVFLPRLVDETTKTDELYETLLDIGEELRHILYHIEDPKFFRYLTASKDGSASHD